MNKTIYILAFVEGMLVMAVELITVRLLSPYYGNSLHVITTVLGITMLSLLSGYYLGARLVAADKHRTLPLVFIVIAAALLCAVPTYSPYIAQWSVKLGLLNGTLVSVLSVLGLPLLLLGAVSPQFIQQISESQERAGTASGNIYAISTLGGVMGTFVLGLYCIPQIGLKKSALIFGLGSIIFSLALVVLSKMKFNAKNPLLLAVPLFVLMSFLIPDKMSTPRKNFNLLYSSDGLLGKLEVLDNENSDMRILANNVMSQSMVNKNTGVSAMSYTHVIATVASFIPPERRNKAAVVGMAAGSLVRELQQLGFKAITAVDIDKRTEKVADTYFNIKKRYL
ncbi:MAG: fused MFS/spermidine synthase [Sphingobacteriales bacterium]|nr:fused MFS/spermidine synthase [Sphingobacteriales bacterium]